MTMLQEQQQGRSPLATGNKMSKTNTQIIEAIDTARTATDIEAIEAALAPIVDVLGNDVIREYHTKLKSCLAAVGTPSFRGIKAALSPNSKSGARYAQALINIRISLQKSVKEEAKGKVVEVPQGAANPQIMALAKAHAKTMEPKEPKAPKAPKEDNFTPCVCGCGIAVKGNFKMGHDARVKGWLLKFARGQGDAVTQSVLDWSGLADALQRWNIPTNSKGVLEYGIAADKEETNKV
jgi:hypothetical protein